MKDARALISWQWFRDNWCGNSYSNDSVKFYCHMTADTEKCGLNVCPKWKKLKEEERGWLEDTREITNIPLRSLNLPRYTVQRCRVRTDTRYGAIHYAEGDYTLCGHEVDENWWTLTTDRDGIATCKKCLSEHKKKTNG